MEKQSPLIQVAINIARDSFSSPLSMNQEHKLKALIKQYIDKVIPYETASRECFKLIETNLPIEKLRGILKTAKEPVPRSQRTDHMVTTHEYRRKTRNWKEDEDKRLLMAIHLYGSENWTIISQFVGNNRTRSMCSQRWTRVLDPNISKQNWSKEDDERLIELVNQYGEKSWMKVSIELGNRSDVQCRYHYNRLKKGGLNAFHKEATNNSIDSSVKEDNNNSQNSFSLNSYNTNESRLLEKPQNADKSYQDIEIEDNLNRIFDLHFSEIDSLFDTDDGFPIVNRNNIFKDEYAEII